MENKINEIKNFYLNSKAPFDETQGFSDVLERLERKEEIPYYRKPLLYIALLLILAGVITGSFVFFPNGKITTAVTDTGEGILNTFIKPTVTPAESKIEEILKKPTPTPTINNASSSSDIRFEEKHGFEDQIREDNSDSSKDENVRGISTQKSENSNSNDTKFNNSFKNSEYHKNENSEKHDNSSPEKPNEKDKD